MHNIESYEEDIIEIVDGIKAISSKIQNSTGWKMEQILGSIRSLMDRFCPYNVGDYVELTRTFECDRSHGWYGYKHDLVKGATAKVVSRDYDYKTSKFRFYLEFDDESWIDSKGDRQSVVSKHIFNFSEDWITRLNHTNCAG